MALNCAGTEDSAGSGYIPLTIGLVICGFRCFTD
jgi:hypothetical protein